MRHAGAPAGAARGQGRADTRAEAAEGAEGAASGHERAPVALSAERLWAVLAALAPMADLASAAGLRAMPVEGRDGQTGGGDPQAGVDRLHASGELARARAAWQQLDRVRGPHRVVLGWLTERAVCWDRPGVRAVAARYALDEGPTALREALPRAVEAREAAEAVLATAKVVAQVTARGAITVAQADAQALVTQRQAEEARAEAALVAWGWGRIAAAVEAWEAAGEKSEVGC